MTTLLYVPHNILVTGGAGFIGSNFIRYLLANAPNLHIINLDALTYAGSLDNLHDLPNAARYYFVEGNICDSHLVATLFEQHQIDTVIHFAAESHVDRSIAGPEAFIETNLVGTFTLLEVARNNWLQQRKLTPEQCRFHHISTDEVYGTLHAEDPAFSESTPYAPNSPYSASKAGSDHLVRAYYHTYGLPVTTSNCSNNYGPYQHAEKLIPTIIQHCLTGQAIPVYGDGSNIRDWLYVEDHCRAIMAILHHGKLGETYNIGGCNEWTNIDIVKHICQRLDTLRPRQRSYSSLIQFVKDRPGHDWRYAIDISKIKRELAWMPQETFITGVEKTLQFYLREPSFA